MTKNSSEKALTEAVLNAEVTDEGIIAESPPTNVPSTPQMTDVEWTDYVLSLFDKRELDPEGHPTTDGIRRIAVQLLGPIIRSIPKIVDCPRADNAYRAVVSFEISIAWGYNRDDVRTFGDAADVYAGNTDAMYARFAIATATTRAEGRALKKALMLRKVYTTEEVTEVPVTEAGLEKYIVTSQIRFIEKFCRDLDINVMRFVNMGGVKYENISHIPYHKAQAMIEFLNGYQQHKETIPENIKGFVSNWQSKLEV